MNHQPSENDRLGSAVVTLPSETEIQITREFDASASAIFEAWTTPELVRRWWGSDDTPLTVCEIDLRIGGVWRYAMEHDGVEIAWHGTYRKIAAPHTLVSTEVFEGVPDAEAVDTLTLSEADGVTTLTVLVQHTSKANRDGHVESGMEAGMQQTLDRLDTLTAVAALADADRSATDHASGVTSGHDAPSVVPGPPSAVAVEMKLELVPMPVTDIDRARAFYVDHVGFVEDVDVRPAPGVRIVQLTPPGSSCSILLSEGLPALTEMTPGTIRGLHLVVRDIVATRAQLAANGVSIGDIEDVGGGVRYATFADPDGNTLVLQEMGWRTGDAY